MCGIAGQCRVDARTAGPEVQKMIDRLQHRGPDGNKVVGGAGWTLGHARLKVMDLSDAAAQPMSLDERYHLSFNGEIYNYRELIERYRLQAGAPLRSKSDFECLLSLYRDYGAGIFSELDGIFAFALYDSQEQELRLVRDPLGVKPLFYMLDAKGIWFASEIKALLEIAEIPRSVDWEAVGDYFSLGYFAGEKTPFAHIRKLAAGHSLLFQRRTGKTIIEPFFDLASVKPAAAANVGAAVEQTRRQVIRSVESQLQADVPIGVMLSGGLDSSIVGAYFRRFKKDTPFHTYSLGFQEHNFDESEFSDAMAARLGSRHHRVAVTPQLFQRAYSAAIAHLDEPNADSSAVPVLLLAQEARKDVSVLLSGDGGDEFFAGYDTLRAARWRQWYLRLPRWIRRAASAAVDCVPARFDKSGWEFKARLFLSGAESELPRAQFAWRQMVPAEVKERLFRGPLKSALRDSAKIFENKATLCAHRDTVNQQLYLDSTLHFTDKLQTKADRMSMAQSIETRVPLAGIGIVKYAFSLPGNQKFYRGRAKYLLKAAFRHELPPAVVNRKKQGLLVPYSQWMRAEWRPWIDSVLGDARGVQEYLDLEYLRELWREHSSGRRDWSQTIFTAMGFIIWHKLYIESSDYKKWILPARPPL